MIRNISASDLVVWSGLAIGGTVLIMIFLIITENVHLLWQRKRNQNAFVKKNDGDGRELEKSEDDTDLIPYHELKKLIPKRLFQRHLLTSIYYLLNDLVICIVSHLLYHFTIRWLENRLIYTFVVLAFDIAFIFLCGSCDVGLWVFGHVCGHNSLSNYPMLDNVIGFTLHSYLLTPYFSFKYSHGVHHSRIKHIDMDDGHSPYLIHPGKKFVENPPRFHWYNVLKLISGWYAYTVFGYSGGRINQAGKKIMTHSHFYKSDLFPPSYPSWKIWLSNIGMLTTLVGIYFFAQSFGWWEAFRKFFGPRLVTNCWIIFITCAHHSHNKLKYLDDKNWSWYKGAIRAMDYEYGGTRSSLLRMAGRAFDFITLRINSAHVCHYLFPTMPHYHCTEATLTIKKALGRHYMKPDSTATAAYFDYMYTYAYQKVNEGEYTYAG